MKKLLILIALGVSMNLFGQNTAHDHSKMEASMKQTPSKQAEPLKEDGIDPVCRMKVKKGVTITTTYKGKQFGFCAEYCKEKFDAKPEKFVKQ